MDSPDIHIKVCSLRFADRLMAAEKWDALISIGRPGSNDEHCTLRAPKSLLLDIWDDAPYWRRVRGLARGEDILRLIEFAREIPVGGRLLVHCKAGRSRSSAAALVVMAARGLASEFAVEHLLKGAPKSNPNGWILKLADALLDWDLFDMCEEVGIVKWRRKTAPPSLDMGVQHA